nr:unnamed protein product [Callosobruchus chinensis]
MDIFMPIAICVIFIILFTICGWCCKRKREGVVYGYGTTTVTDVTVQATPVVNPPYPVHHQTSPAPGYPVNNPPYPTNTPAHPHPQPVYYPYPSYQHSSAGAAYPRQYMPPSMPYPSTGGHPPYPPGPYPPQSTGPYPPTGPTPYPPASGGDYGQPPPYDVAVSSPPPVQPPPIREGYSKQSPYNPDYKG